MHDRSPTVDTRETRSVPRAAAPSGPPDRGRVEWVDAAKGMSILLVVAHHVVMFLQPHGLVPPALSTANVALASLRMPLFFLASGLFVASTLAASWRTVLHKRVAFFGYLYLLWTLVQFGVFQALPAGTAPPDSTQTPGQLASTLLVPAPSMWFLYALAVFTVLAKLFRRVPASVQLAVSGVLCAAVGAELLRFDSFGWTYMARYLFFFLLGCYARRLVMRVASASGPVTVAAALTVSAAGAAGSVLLDLRTVPGVAFVLNLAAVTCGVLLAAVLARHRFARPLMFLGRNTLPIYLANVLWVGAFTVVVRGTALPTVLQWAAPPVLAVVVAGLCLLAHRLLRAAGGGWLYDLPGPLAYRPA